MFSSLPDYSRFAEAALKRLRKDPKQMPSNRIGGMVFNMVILAGLWGVPLYARWVILPDIQRAKSEPPPLIGKWRTTNGSHFSIAFKEDGQFVLSWKETVIETARYWFENSKTNDIALADFRKQPGNQPIGEEYKCWFRVSLAGNTLSTKPSWFANNERSRLKDHLRLQWKIEGEGLSLWSAVFERVE